MACVNPPAPKVQSTRTGLSTSAGTSSASASSSMTGTWLVESKLGHQIGHPLGRRAGLAPIARRPHLDARQRTDQHRIALERSVLAQRRRDEKPTLGIQRDLLGVREQMPDEGAVLRVLARRG